MKDLREERGFELANLFWQEIQAKAKENEWIVPSATTGYRYRVSKGVDAWDCECNDHKYRKVDCKHIHAIKAWQELRKQMQEYDAVKPQVLAERQCCQFCLSYSVVKNGCRKNEHTIKQRWACRSCGKTFVVDAFEKRKADGKAITLVMDLYFKGVSLRKIQDHLKQFYSLEIHHETIRRWINDYMTVINGYVSELKPEVSKQWHADEMMVKAGGKWLWVWNCMDSQTRFLLAERVTQTRMIGDARELFKDAKTKAGFKPEVLITDGLEQYKTAFAKEFLPRGHRFSFKHTSKHYAYAGFPDKTNNNLIERFHGSMRERTKVQRGLQNKETASKMLENLTTYYNFLRNHSALGKTPAEQAGINLELKENRWQSLIEKARLSEKTLIPQTDYDKSQKRKLD